MNMTRQSKNSSKRQRSISMEQSRDEGKNMSAISKKRNSASRQAPAQVSNQRKGESAAGKTAK